jgi:uncharacterized protein
MKLQPDKSDAQTLTAHGPGWVAVEELGAEHFAQLASLGAELVIFGSGARIRFPQPAWIQPLMARRTGVETMDTGAACRTYNILAGEGRHVVAALLIERPENGQ